ncbi:MAG: NAD(P)-binding domain-containing protein, partial [Methanobacteriales archaeon]|nr:NAD(P)-binding domain-containing protein [Methanobacteriales archaeon]
MIVGIVGCGAIANIITGYVLEEDSNIQLRFFYDRDLEKAENLASMADGIAVLKVEDMLDKVDLIIEAASPEAVAEIVPDILKAGKDVLIMSVGALMDKGLRSKIEDLATKNNANVYIPSGAIVGLDGIKAASIGE